MSWCLFLLGIYLTITIFINLPKFINDHRMDKYFGGVFVSYVGFSVILLDIWMFLGIMIGVVK